MNGNAVIEFFPLFPPKLFNYALVSAERQDGVGTEARNRWLIIEDQGPADLTSTEQMNKNITRVIN